MKKALITGINGSGATYLAEYLSYIPGIQIQGISRWHTDRKNKSGIFSKIEMFFLENLEQKLYFQFFSAR